MDTYTLGHHDSVLRSHRWRTIANSAGYLVPHVTPGARILDVGCGPGTITADFARLVGHGGHVLGIDPAPEVIALARQQHAPAGAGNLQFAVGDIMNTYLAEPAYDVVHAHQVLQHLRDPIAALRQMRRLTRPGGLVAIRDADYAAMTWHPQPAGLDRWLATYRALARRNGAEPDAGRRLLGWAQQAGFADVAASASVWCFATPEDREWWAGLQAERITTSAVAEQALAAALADEAALAAMADAWRAWGDAPDGWFAVLHGEVLCRVGRADDPRR